MGQRRRKYGNLMLIKFQPQTSESGRSIVEMMVGLLLMAGLVAGALTTFQSTAASFSDNEVITRAEEQGREILEMMAFELRTAGSGMALGQTNFAPGDAGLGTSPLPVLTTSNATAITFRSNSRGEDSITSADYTPSVSTLVVPVADTSSFETNDVIYLTDATARGEDGLTGTVTNVTSNSVLIGAAYVASPGASFDAGSLIAKVEDITYTATGGSITRTDGDGTVTISTNASFALSYFDKDGVAIALPLTDASVRDRLAAIDLDITVNGQRELRTDGAYAALAAQRIYLRNLNLARTDLSAAGPSTPTPTPSATPPPTATPTATPPPTPTCATYTSSGTCPSSYCRWQAGTCRVR